MPLAKLFVPVVVMFPSMPLGCEVIAVGAPAEMVITPVVGFVPVAYLEIVNELEPLLVAIIKVFAGMPAPVTSIPVVMLVKLDTAVTLLLPGVTVAVGVTVTAPLN